MSTELSTTVQPRGLALTTFDEAMRFATLVAKSEFAPKDFRGKPESCLLAVQHGQELGLSPMQSLQSIAVVNGRPAVYGDTALAVVKGSAVCEWVRETIEGDGDSMTAVCQAKRRGDPHPVEGRFSMADAKRAGLASKDVWKSYPRRMLQMRARGFALRDAFPDVLRGLVTAEEAQDYTHTETPVVEIPTPEPPPKVAGVEDMEKARLAISKAANLEKLKSIALVVHQRQDDGFYTSEQAHELLDMLDDRRDLLTTEVEEVPA